MLTAGIRANAHVVAVAHVQRTVGFPVLARVFMMAKTCPHFRNEN